MILFPDDESYLVFKSAAVVSIFDSGVTTGGNFVGFAKILRILLLDIYYSYYLLIFFTHFNDKDVAGLYACVPKLWPMGSICRYVQPHETE